MFGRWLMFRWLGSFAALSIVGGPSIIVASPLQVSASNPPTVSQCILSLGAWKPIPKWFTWPPCQRLSFRASGDCKVTVMRDPNQNHQKHFHEAEPNWSKLDRDTTEINICGVVVDAFGAAFSFQGFDGTCYFMMLFTHVFLLCRRRNQKPAANTNYCTPLGMRHTATTPTPALQKDTFRQCAMAQKL